MVRIVLVVLGVMHWLLVVSMLVQMRLAVVLQHESMVVIVLALRMQYLQLLLGAANLDGLLNQMLILLLDVDGHGVIMMKLDTLMRRCVLVIHLVMHLGLLVFWLVFGVLLVLVFVDFQCARSNGKQRQARQLRGRAGKTQKEKQKKKKSKLIHIWYKHFPYKDSTRI